MDSVIISRKVRPRGCGGNLVSEVPSSQPLREQGSCDGRYVIHKLFTHNYQLDLSSSDHCPFRQFYDEFFNVPGHEFVPGISPPLPKFWTNTRSCCPKPRPLSGSTLYVLFFVPTPSSHTLSSQSLPEVNSVPGYVSVSRWILPLTESYPTTLFFGVWLTEFVVLR